MCSLYVKHYPKCVVKANNRKGHPSPMKELPMRKTETTTTTTKTLPASYDS